MVAFPVVQGLNRVRFQHPGTTTEQLLILKLSISKVRSF